MHNVEKERGRLIISCWLGIHMFEAFPLDTVDLWKRVYILSCNIIVMRGITVLDEAVA